MKCIVHTAALAASITVGCIAAAPVNAATSYRSDLQMAAAACQPFFTTTQARYSASGLTNAGTAQFYVACSGGGFWQGYANQGNSYMGIVVNNPTAASISVSCTARPGYIHGTGNFQSASPKSAVIAAGGYKNFTWYPADFSTVSLSNPNFTCTLPPGAAIQYIETYRYVDVGN